MATEKRLKGIPYKCDNCIYIAACQRACIIFDFPFLDYMIHSASCSAYEPKTDAVEVVRCKDCRYCMRDMHGLWCFNDYEHNLQPDDFCSRGERKDNG